MVSDVVKKFTVKVFSLFPLDILSLWNADFWWWRKVYKITVKVVKQCFGNASSSQSLLMIRCCGNLVPEESPEARTKLALEIWSTLEKLGVPFDISHYNALLRVYLENEHPFSPTSFLAELEKKGIEPNRVTYQRLITRFCLDGDIEGASRVLEFMKRKDVPINESVFGSLILGHARSGDLESARAMLGVMRQAQLEPTADTYATLMTAVAEKGDIEAMRWTIKESKDKDVQFSDKDYLEAVFALAKHGHEDHVDEMLSNCTFQSGYMQEAMNVAIRLISCGKVDAAYKVYLTIPIPMNVEGRPMPSGHFFIRQIVRSNQPLESVLKYCSQFVQDDRNPFAFQEALRHAVVDAPTDVALSLMSAMKARGIPIRAHYFWPLLVRAGKEGNRSLQSNLLSRMASYDVPPTVETLLDYVFPYFPIFPVEVLMQSLAASGVSEMSIQNALVLYHLQNNNFTDAATIASKFKTRVVWHVLHDVLLSAIGRIPKESPSRSTEVVAILKKAKDFRSGNKYVDDLGGKFLEEMIQKAVPLRHFTDLLKTMVHLNVGISVEAMGKVISRLGDGATDEISRLLEHLSTEVGPSEREGPPRGAGGLSSLERQLQRGETVTERNLKPVLLHYARIHNLERTDELLKLAEKNNIELTNKNKIVILDMYSACERPDQAVALYQEILQSGIEQLSIPKMIRFLRCLINAGRTQEALQILSDQKPLDEIPSEDDIRAFEVSIWHMMNCLVERRDKQHLEEAFNLIVSKRFAKPSTMLLSPFIKYKVVEGDLEGAVKEFERCAAEYDCTPYRPALCQKLIEKEDTAGLQRVMDCNTKVHGELNAMYDLVFTFIECGRLRQAKKIMDTPGFRARNNRLEFICRKYLEENNVKAIEDLITVSKDVFDVDRERLYFYLLLAHCKAEDSAKALGVWTTLQEEDISASKEFLLYLSRYLESHGEKVPFVVPDYDPIPQSTDEVNRDQRQGRSKVMLFLRRGDLEAALVEKTRLEGMGQALTVTETSALIEQLLRNERLSESARLATALLSRGTYPFPKTLKYLCTRLAIAGDTATLNLFEDLIPKELHARLSLANQCFYARVQAGQGNDALSKLEAKLLGHPDPQTLFPPGGILALLEKEVSLLPRVEKLAERCAKEMHFLTPVNMLWVHYVERDNRVEADRIWNDYLKDAPSVLSRSLVNTIKTTCNPEMGHYVLDRFIEGKVSSGVVGFVVSSLLSVYTKLNNPGAAMDVLKRVFEIKRCGSEHLSKGPMETLKSMVESSGQLFPYPIPEKVSREPELNGEHDVDSPHV